MTSQESILDEIVENLNCTNKLKDKLLIERIKILEEYAQNEKNKELYYIYAKSSKDNNLYLITRITTEVNNVIIELDKANAPLNSGIDCILKKENNRFILDEEATEYIQKKMIERFNEIIDEENKTTNRIEGHIYEFVEKTGGSAWLIDKNQEQMDKSKSYDVFEEKNFSEELLKNAKEGDLFQYINEEYKILIQ